MALTTNNTEENDTQEFLDGMKKFGVKPLKK
jgi:hypothetical protein